MSGYPESFKYIQDLEERIQELLEKHITELQALTTPQLVEEKKEELRKLINVKETELAMRARDLGYGVGGLKKLRDEILYGRKGENTYIITKRDREKIKHFTINNFDKERRKDKLQLELTDDYHTRLSSIGDNFVIADTKGSLTIENAFGPEKEDYNHLELQLTFENKSSLIKTYQLKDIVQTIEDTLDNSQAEDVIPLSILSLKTYSSLANEYQRR